MPHYYQLTVCALTIIMLLWEVYCVYSHNEYKYFCMRLVSIKFILHKILCNLSLIILFLLIHK